MTEPTMTPTGDPNAQQPAPVAAPTDPATQVVEQPAPQVEAHVQVDSIPTFNGVPLFDFDNPFGGFGVGVLVGFDPAASHEQGQPATSPATDQADAIAWQPSGGSAYYQDFMTGKGWSKPLGKGSE